MPMTPQPSRAGAGSRFAASAPEAARKLARLGRSGDTLLAHITPGEAMLLRLLGGAGSRNPHTGAFEFFGSGDNSDAAGGQEGGPGGPTGGAGNPGGYGDPGDTGGGSGASIGEATGGYGSGGWGAVVDALTPGFVDVLNEAFGGKPAGAKGVMGAVSSAFGMLGGPAAGLVGLGMLGTAGLQALTGGAGKDAGEGLNDGSGGNDPDRWAPDGADEQAVADARAAADAAAAAEAERVRRDAFLADERVRLRRRARGRALLLSGTERGFGAGMLSGAG